MREEEEKEEKKKMTPQEVQAILFQILGFGMSGIIAIMAVGILFDVIRTMFSISGGGNRLISQPLFWHKIGMILVTFPIGIGFVSYLFFLPLEARQRYFWTIAAVSLLGGLINLFSAVGFFGQPASDSTTFYLVFSFIMVVLSVAGLFVLRWISTQKGRLETEFGYASDLQIGTREN